MIDRVSKNERGGGIKTPTQKLHSQTSSGCKGCSLVGRGVPYTNRLCCPKGKWETHTHTHSLCLSHTRLFTLSHSSFLFPCFIQESDTFYVSIIIHHWQNKTTYAENNLKLIKLWFILSKVKKTQQKLFCIARQTFLLCLVVSVNSKSVSNVFDALTHPSVITH